MIPLRWGGVSDMALLHLLVNAKSLLGLQDFDSRLRCEPYLKHIAPRVGELDLSEAECDWHRFIFFREPDANSSETNDPRFLIIRYGRDAGEDAGPRTR